MENKYGLHEIGSRVILGVVVLFLLSCGKTLNAAVTVLELVSDEATEWSADGISWEPTVACWIHPYWPDISGATWVWRTFQTDVAWEYANVPTGGWYFRKVFTVPHAAYDISGSIEINGDNAYLLYVNGVEIGGDGTMNKNGPYSTGWWDTDTFVVENFQAGENTILIRALNHYSSGTYSSNPAGVVFRALITYDVTPVQVAVDIKPGSCPNPLNLASRGVLPVAVLGSEDFDVSSI
ncbi:MAG: hypothetical protein ACYTBJ_24405, partial [Planctomycetota bacterium]